MRVIDKDTALALLAAHPSTRDASGCQVCALARRTPGDVEHVAHDEHGVVVLNRFARREGHLLVIARQHVEHMHQLPWETYAALQRLAHEASIAIQHALSPERTYCAVLGSSAPLATSYPHVHIHVLPVYESDERARPARVFSWSEGVVVYEDHEAAALCARLRAAWPTRAATT